MGCRVLADTLAWLEAQPGGVGRAVDRAVALAALAQEGMPSIKPARLPPTPAP